MLSFGEMVWVSRVELALLAGFCVISHAVGESLPFSGLDDLRGPYDGTGVLGEALYVQPIGKAGNLPVCAFWSSSNTSRSPFLGFGWSIPVLESRFVQLDERRWAFYQPDGYRRIFVPVKHGDGNALTGGSAWKAVVNGNSIRVTADPQDGKPKSMFFFSNGRLFRMDCEEGCFEIIYKGRVASSIVSQGKTLLEVERVSVPKKCVEFRFNGGRSKAVAVCSEATVFGEPEDSSSTPTSSKEQCLASLKTARGEVKFSYGVDDGEAFFAAGGTRWKWDVRTRKILACGDWAYTIGETDGKEDEQSFDRRHADGRHESHFYNRRTGMVRQEFADGTCQSYRVFTSGPLAYRRAKWAREMRADSSVVYTEYTYNEAGRLVGRKTKRDGEDEGVVEELLDESGRILRRRVNGKEVSVK